MKKQFSVAVVIALGALVLGSCSFGMDPEVTSSSRAYQTFMEQYAVAYHSFEQEDAVAALSVQGGGLSISATVTPPAADNVTFPAAGQTKTLDARLNYPSLHQQTVATVEPTGVERVYRVTAVTTPMSGYEQYFRERETVEVYYVKDVRPGNPNEADGLWTNDDDIVRPDGTVDRKYRERFVTTYRDGSRRTEMIADLRQWDADSWFARFDLNGSLEMPELSTFAPVGTTDGGRFSSQVIYKHEVGSSYDFWFWGPNVTGTVYGVRWYTEQVVDGRLYGTTYALEETVGQDGRILARSVVRQEVSFTGNDEAGWTASSRAQRTRVVINSSSGELLWLGNSGAQINRLPPQARDTVAANMAKKVLESVIDEDAEVIFNAM